MKFLTFTLKNSNKDRFGFVFENKIIDINKCAEWIKGNKNNSSFNRIPSTLTDSLKDWDVNLSLLVEMNELIKDSDVKKFSFLSSEIIFLPPVPNPPSFRDFYAFEQHVMAARKLRGLEMNPDWYKIPIFYFSNPNCCYGHKQEISYPKQTDELDFELEFAIIVGNGGINIDSSDAEKYIAGYTILNDWSARDLQREEMLHELAIPTARTIAPGSGHQHSHTQTNTTTNRSLCADTQKHKHK